MNCHRGATHTRQVYVPNVPVVLPGLWRHAGHDRVAATIAFSRFFFLYYLFFQTHASKILHCVQNLYDDVSTRQITTVRVYAAPRCSRFVRAEAVSKRTRARVGLS